MTIMKKKILVLCTGNSCRSQMAEGFLKSFDSELEVYSAGTFPASRVSPNAIIVMNELGIDISQEYTKNVEKFLNDSFDFVITVCDDARESCPVFTGKVKEQLHIGFYDPTNAIGTREQILTEHRKVRDEIKDKFYGFYKNKIIGK